MNEQNKHSQNVDILEEELTFLVRHNMLSRLAKLERIPTKDNVLKTQSVGMAIGPSIATDIPFVVDYYGYLKRTDGQEAVISEALKKDPSLRHITATVIHFASIHAEDIMDAFEMIKAKSPDTNALRLTEFVELKNWILGLRGFRKRTL